ncbi:helicase C-terminal domain-containing protein [Natronoarchaeum rubrum]|uniref:helicase C-terminal domain-containing protein n=1 Tax=Natronoarchaeum rubrum TaxID=755311 RepID=UPI002113532C|nr:ATP-dependent DNA helicase [Natronoarchaeum rubrum]
MDASRILDEFPAPSYRGNQQQALADIREAFEAGNDVVLVRAPTGSGKSLLARAIAGCARRGDDAAPSEATNAYYTTPQVSQLDDVAGDDLLEDLSIIRGKSNYDCILPGETDTPVDQAPCARERGYDCSVKHRCPYFSDRAIASNRRIAAMTLAYFMQTAGSDVFRKRDVCVIDEAHGLAEWAEMYATTHLGPRTVPMWEDLRVPDLDGPDQAVDYADALIDTCTKRKDDLLQKGDLEPAEAAERDRLQELISELKWFVEDYRDPQSSTTWLVDQNDREGGDGQGEGGPVTIKPMDPERYLKHTVWDRANKFALLSATILNKEAFCRQVGLDPADVALVDVGHTFPVEHRPLYDVAQGKMTYEHRDETIPNVARTIVRIMREHDDEKGLIHCHSYDIQSRLEERLGNFGVGQRVRTHDREDRDAALDAWKDSDRPDVFLSVKMEEALDLEGDLARWQVICKAPYPNTGDSRVAHRLEDGQWSWYYRTALRTVIQGCGRVVRAPDDYGATYLADSSLLDLFDRASHDVPDWFDDQLVEMSEPELPAFDPDAAIGVADSTDGRRRDRAGSSSGRSSPNGSSGGRSSASSRGSTGSSSRGSRSSSSSRDSSPIADVWDTDG